MKAQLNATMDLAIVGYGRMGQQVAQLATAHGYAITHAINDRASLDAAHFAGHELAMVFTPPAACVPALRVLAERGISAVVGTTGWYNHLGAVERLVKDAGTGLLWSANFSVGVHLFWRALRHVAHTMHAANDYDVYGYEAHHQHKVDAPSGTALRTADILLDKLPHKTQLVTALPERALHPHELHWSSIRGGSVPGTHAVVFDSPFDSLELRHTARSPTGFAEGALAAAAWLQGRTGCYSMDAFMNATFFHEKQFCESP